MKLFLSRKDWIYFFSCIILSVLVNYQNYSMTQQDGSFTQDGAIMPNIAETEADSIALALVKLHSSEVKVTPETFLDLLKHSLSLSTLEKKRVIDAVPTLSQFQFDELAKVFIEEREKFRELSKEHPDDIKKLLKKQQVEWLQLGDLYKAEQAAKQWADADKQKEEEIRKSLWL